MGLTIHYSFQANVQEASAARQLVDQLHLKALDLPFQSVGEVIELSGDPANFNNADRKDPNFWLLLQSSRFIKRGENYLNIPPLHLIAFSVQPGDGSEPANFGLARYPASGVFDEGEFETGLVGWSWASFCKTQYASNPKHGGTDNFLQCHTALVALLDHTKSLGVLSDVRDEGGYWQKRDVDALAKEVGDWNKTIAGKVGKAKDEHGQGVESAIGKFPNFEHLEADDAKCRSEDQ